MQLKQFPHQYALNKRIEAKQIIAQIRNNSEQKQKTIYANTPSAPNPWTFGCLSAVIGYFVCCIVVGLLSLVLGAVVASFLMIVSFVLWGCFSISRYKGKKETYETGVRGAQYATTAERTQTEQSVHAIEEQIKHEIEEYQKLFEAEAQRVSVEFAESELATEVINWMTDGFSRTIDATDRRSHIEKINVPFFFNVYASKITCNRGTYDFEIKRCANLTSPLQQTALARAIASAIMLRIAIAYPQDPSGSESKTDISYTYAGVGSDEHVAVTMTYAAPNGNYRSVKHWQNY